VKVQFQCLSGSPDSLYWDFDDGTTSTQLNPQHTFSIPRKYYVKLFVKNCFFCALLRRILTLLELVSSSVSINALPYSNLFSQARTILNADSSIETLIISGSPFESFHFGYELKKEFPHIHWIPSYRDEWTTFQGIKPIDFISKLKYYMDQQNEKKWVSNCTKIISVSDNWVKNIGKFIGKDGFQVMNGYELDLFQEEGECIFKDNEFVLTYNGTIYQEQDFLFRAP
jgi:hypothetical protein